MNSSNTDDKYKFTGKERDKETGYDYFGARLYDCEIGRWLQVDPSDEDSYGYSPYAYCFEDPITKVDLDGRSAWDFIAGVVMAIGKNINPLAKEISVSQYQGDKADYVTGHVVGDIAAALIGGTEAALGSGTSGIGVAVSVTGVGIVAGAPISVLGGAVAVHGVGTVSGALISLNADMKSLNSQASNGKNEKHGDGGRAISKAEKQVQKLEAKLKEAKGSKAIKIRHKMIRIKKIAEGNAKGTEDSRANKR